MHKRSVRKHASTGRKLTHASGFVLLQCLHVSVYFFFHNLFRVCGLKEEIKKTIQNEFSSAGNVLDVVCICQFIFFISFILPKKKKRVWIGEFSIIKSDDFNLIHINSRRNPFYKIILISNHFDRFAILISMYVLIFQYVHVVKILRKQHDCNSWLQITITYHNYSVQYVSFDILQIVSYLFQSKWTIVINNLLTAQKNKSKKTRMWVRRTYMDTNVGICFIHINDFIY